ncbi:outer membrane autotransporter protein [Bradyrhizobium japonicum]
MELRKPLRLLAGQAPRRHPLRARVLSVVLPCVIIIAAPQAARAQCTTDPVNGGILQNGGTCVANNPVSTGFNIAVSALNGANVTTNGTVTANGGGTGIQATTNATVTANTNVTAASTGLIANTGGTIIINAITLANSGGGGAAMIATTGTIIANSTTVNWNGGAAVGVGGVVQATAGGLIQFTPGSSINLSGGFGKLMTADGATSQIIANGLSVNMGASGGMTAATAQNGGSIQLASGSSITFAGGGGNTGLSATGTNSSITATDLSLSVGNGGGDVGVNAASGGQVTLTRGSVTVPGIGGGEIGLRATGANSLVTANDVVVSVTGGGGNAGVNATTGGTVTTSGGSVSVVNGAGGLLQNGGNVTMTGTDVTASGNGGFGFLFNGSGNTLQYSNATIVASAASFSVQGGAANISLSNAVAVTNNNTLLETVSGASTTFNAQASTLRGVITTAAGGISTVTLAQNSAWTMTGNSNATNLTNNSSEIIFTPPTADPTQLSSYKTLIANNYGGAGGLITLNTFLGNDTSPSDRLVINGGAATGSTTLRVLNTTGPGDQTVANGILLVQTVNNATTAPGAFSLAGEVRGGAYDYFLFRGGINGNAPQDWFLRSTFDSGPTPPDPPIIPPPILPPDPPPDGLPPGSYPIIGPGLATYGSVQPMARQIGLATLGTLNQRVGDTMTLLNAGTDPNGWGRSDWARVFGQQINGHYQAFADPRTDGWLAGFQGGIDLWRGSTIPGHRDSAGLYFAYTQARADVTGLVTNPAATGYMLTHTGTNDIQAYSAGGYWTHYGPTGWYLDAILQGTLYRGNATTQFTQLPLKGAGFVASLETGYPIPLPLGPGFVLEPQAQIIWQRVSFDEANDGLGPVGLGTTSGPIGRLGLRGQWNIASSNGMLLQPYAGVNYWRSWGAGADTTFGIDQVLLLQKMQTVETFVGFTGKLDKSYSVYAQFGYQFDVGSTVNAGPQGAKGTAGIRYSW